MKKKPYKSQKSITNIQPPQVKPIIEPIEPIIDITQQKPESPKYNITTIIVIILLFTFCISAFIYTFYIQIPYSNEIHIVKIKFNNGDSIVDNCNHPYIYSNPSINITDVYEINISHGYFGERITGTKLVNKEKYIENCSIT
jgi:hypothetical protein